MIEKTWLLCKENGWGGGAFRGENNMLKLIFKSNKLFISRFFSVYIFRISRFLMLFSVRGLLSLWQRIEELVPGIHRRPLRASARPSLGPRVSLVIIAMKAIRSSAINVSPFADDNVKITPITWVRMPIDAARTNVDNVRKCT